MIDVETGVVIADELFGVEEVVRVEAIYIGLVGRRYDEEGEGQESVEVTGIEADIGVAEGRPVQSFVYIEMKGIVMVLTAEESLYAFGKL